MTNRRDFGVLALGGLLALSGCAAAPPRPPAKTAPSSASIRDLLAQRMARNGVGMVAGVIDGRGPRVVAHGKTGAGDNRPLDGDTVFQIGSLTKPFTTLLLSDMVVRGEVKLDDPAQLYLPAGVRMPGGARPITLRDLAWHVSGLPSMPGNHDMNGLPDPIAAYTVDQLYEFLSTYTLTREPGEAYQYSNLGVSLLGRLLAMRMNTDYETLLKQRVLAPLGMNSTSITLSTSQQRRLAPGHDVYLHPVESFEMRTLQASGSLRSTANDLLLWLSAYLGHRDTPLREAMRLQLAERRTNNGQTHALSWFIGASGLAAHDGGKAGYRAAAVFHVEEGVGAVVLANARTYDEPLPIAIHLAIGRALEHAPDAPPPKPRLDIPAADLAALAGTYRAPDGQVFDIAPRRGILLVQMRGSGVVTFVARERNLFFLDTGNDEMSFETAVSGSAPALIHYPNGKADGLEVRVPRIP